MRDTCVGLQALVPLCKFLLGVEHTNMSRALLGTGYGEGIFLRSTERLSLLAGAILLQQGAFVFTVSLKCLQQAFPTPSKS